MEAFLIDDWLRDVDPIPVVDIASVSLVRERVRELARVAQLSEEATGSAVIVASELAHNALAHGAQGAVGVRAIERNGVAGLEIVGADAGPGIADPAAAFRGAPRSTGSLGIGLAGVRALSDELDVDVRLGEGTCIRARKFAGTVARRREVGIVARPHPNERASGDQACFIRLDHDLVVAVVDGLGHGPEARRAADRAQRVVRSAPSVEPVEILRRVDSALTDTRGAVMTVACLRESGELRLAGVGNVTTRIARWGDVRLFEGSSFVLGLRPATAKRFATEQTTLEPRDVLIMTTDGIASQIAVESRSDLLREAPVVIAQTILAEFGRDHDDATVLVMR